MRKLSSELRLARLLLPAVLLFTVFLVLGSGSATAATPSCGDTITHDTTLTADLTNCLGDGLVIGADDVTVNLNGHTIGGTTTQGACDTPPFGVAGIRVGGFDGVTIENGTIQQFFNGVDGGGFGVSMSNGYLHDLVLRDNRFSGIFIGSNLPRSNADIRIEHNDVYGNGCLAGISLNNASDNHVAFNEVRDNGFDGSPDNAAGGIGVCCGSADTVVEHNDVHDNNGDGIAGLIEDVGNVIRDNRSHDNNGAGVDIGGDVDGNRVEGNRLVHDLFGVLMVEGNRNTVAGNRISDIRDCVSGPCGVGVVIAIGDGNVVAANQVARVALDGIAVVALDPGTTTSNTLVRDNLVHAAAHDDYSVGALGEGTVTDTTLAGNLALTAGHDGFDIFSAGTTLTHNKAFANGDLGFEAVDGTIDGGGNLAHGNGDPAQCTGVSCG